MDSITFLIVLATFVSWGVGSFFAKIIVDKIGAKSVFFATLGYTPAVLLYSLMAFKMRDLLQVNKGTAIFAIITGAIGSFGSIGLYYLLARTEASRAIPLTALYPALTAVLAIVFLHEGLNWSKGIGIFLSLVAIYLLSR